jgi:uncharacterized membrane protein YfcA
LIPENYLFLAIAIFFSALLQAGTGFGFSILATPLLLIVFPNPAAIQINIILSIVLSAMLFPREKKHMDLTLLRRLSLSSIVALPFGVLLAVRWEAKMLSLVLGIILLMVTALLCLRLRFTRSATRDRLTGALSGLMTASAAMPGPVILVYFLGLSLDKAVLRSTALCYFGLIYAVGLLFHVSFINVARETWLAALTLVPALLIGLLCGWRLFNRASESSFRKILISILLLTGLVAVLSGL